MKPTRWQRIIRRLRGKCSSYRPIDRFGYGPHLCEEPYGHSLPHGSGPEFTGRDGVTRAHYSTWAP